MSKFVQHCSNFQNIPETFPNLTYVNLCKLVQIYQKLSQYFRTFPKLFKFVQTCCNLFKLAQDFLFSNSSNLSCLSSINQKRSPCNCSSLGLKSLFSLVKVCNLGLKQPYFNSCYLVRVPIFSFRAVK